MCRKLAKNQKDKAQKEKALKSLQDRLTASCRRLLAAEKALRELEEARPDSIQAGSSPQPLCNSHHAMQHIEQILQHASWSATVCSISLKLARFSSI